MHLPAITLWRPWPGRVCLEGKTVENRGHFPWPAIRGKRFALHAGQRFEGGKLDEARYAKLDPLYVAKGIVATAILAAVLREGKAPEVFHDSFGGMTDNDADWWEIGHFGWVLRDVRVFTVPIPALGSQGAWTWEVPECVSGPKHDAFGQCIDSVTGWPRYMGPGTKALTIEEAKSLFVGKS